MVVLATSLCTKNGKVLVSRQFVSISRSRIEGLLAAFPKLLSGTSNQQHTFIETSSVRYLYQRFEDLFLVVITNKASNIIEDLETLRILTKVVPEFCGPSLNEKAVIDNGFELIFAFDEVVSLGYKESVTLEQIRTFTELDSHEEKIHEMIEKNKEREAHEEAKRRIKEIERERREREKLGLTGGGVGSMSSIGSSSIGSMGNMGGMGGMGGGTVGSTGGIGNMAGGIGGGRIPIGSNMASNYAEPVSPRTSYKPQEERRPRKGLQLNKKPQSQGIIEQIDKEAEIIPQDTGVTKEPEVIREAVQISISEQLSCSFDTDGGLIQMQINGEFFVTITEESAVNAQILFQKAGDMQFRVHPNVNRDLFQKGILSILQNKSYPLDTPTSVLKWRFQTTDDAYVPLRVNVWTTPSNNRLIVNVEYELTPPYELNDVTVTLNIVARSSPLVSTEQGTTKFDPKSNTLEWNIPLIDRDNSRGNMELDIEPWENSNDRSWLFPVLVSFSTTTTFANIKISGVEYPNGGPIPFFEKKLLQVQHYTISNQ